MTAASPSWVLETLGTQAQLLKKQMSGLALWKVDQGVLVCNGRPTYFLFLQELDHVYRSQCDHHTVMS